MGRDSHRPRSVAGFPLNVLERYERIYRSDRSDKIWLPEHQRT
jgi:hypothetical protein